MAYVTWTPQCSVGIARFDQQHQGWIDLINRLNDAMRVGKGRDAVGPVLSEVIEYTRTHFRDEERAMKAARYAAFAAHKAAHDAFIAEITQLQSAHSAGQVAISVAVSARLSDWFMQHIREMDRSYAPHLQAAGIR
jgi:hemerythrin